MYSTPVVFWCPFDTTMLLSSSEDYYISAEYFWKLSNSITYFLLTCKLTRPMSLPDSLSCNCSFLASSVHSCTPSTKDESYLSLFYLGDPTITTKLLFIN